MTTLSDDGTNFFRISPFCCPHCGQTSDFAGHCPHCDVALHDQREAAPWQIDARSRNVVTRVPWVAYLLLTAYLSLFAIVVGAALSQCLGRAPTMAIVLALAALVTHRWRNDPERAAERAMILPPPAEARSKPVAHVSDGERVRFEGPVHVRRLAIADDGPKHLAREQRYLARLPLSVRLLGGKTTTVVATGGEFELRTPEGVPVIVRLDRFVMVNATPMKDGEFIAPDATVRVSGVARWVTDEEASGMRTIRRHLELVSTENSPIVIEVIPTEKPIEQRITTENESPTGVRVRVDDSCASPESLELDPRLHESTTRSARREME